MAPPTRSKHWKETKGWERNMASSASLGPGVPVYSLHQSASMSVYAPVIKCGVGALPVEMGGHSRHPEATQHSVQGRTGRELQAGR